MNLYIRGACTYEHTRMLRLCVCVCYVFAERVLCVCVCVCGHCGVLCVCVLCVCTCGFFTTTKLEGGQLGMHGAQEKTRN